MASERIDTKNAPADGLLILPPKPLIIKGNDGEPLLRKTIQYDFLQSLFEDDTACFTDSSLQAPNNKVTFSQLYMKDLLSSNKMTGSQRVKMEQTREFGLVMAQVCLLVNVGRINTTLAFYPDMRTALRYYHSIPSLQRDETTRQHMYDAARMKTVLKGCITTENPPINTPLDILSRQAQGIRPACNPVAAIFIFTSHSTHITRDHFKDCEFMDIFLPSPFPSQMRAKAFLWLLYHYLEDSKGPNPFKDPASRNPKLAPSLLRLTPEQMDLENVDTPEEIEYGRKMFQYRVEFLSKTEAEYAQDAAKGKIDPHTNVRGQKAMKKKAAIGKALQEEMAALETQSNISRASSQPPHHLGHDDQVGSVIGGISAKEVMLAQTEQNAKHQLTQQLSLGMVDHAMGHMVTTVIDSEDEDNESYMQGILERRLAILHTFCSPSVQTPHPVS